MRKIFRIIHDADFAFKEEKGEFCTIHGEDFAFSEGKDKFSTKHRVLIVETLKNRCSNICILRAYGENTCQGPLFGGNKKRNRKTSEAQTKGINL